MPLNDVWRNINREIGIYWRGRFDDVPVAPGIYAWFYPLRITSEDLGAFIDEINTVLSFDAKLKGDPCREIAADFTWDVVDLRVRKRPKSVNVAEHLQSIWDRVVADSGAFERMRRSVMRASLFMPPLYVGKAQVLSVRCGQHRAGTGRNDFHQRYQEFASSTGLPARNVNDLIFACIRTAEDEFTDDRAEEVVEEIVKHACKPVYCVR